MLSWFIKEPSIAAALGGMKLTETSLLSVNCISNSCLDENIELNWIKAYFTKTGWSTILKSVEKVQKMSWLCSNCRQPLDGDQIGCDGCLKWRHYNCAAVKKAPKSKNWFCRDCR